MMEKNRKLAGLTFKEKVEYIFNYYKFRILTAIIVAGILAWGINHYIINPPPPIFINVSFYGGVAHIGLGPALEEHINENLAPEGYATVVGYHFPEGGGQRDMSAMQHFSTMIAAGMLDILLVAPGESTGLRYHGVATNLQEILPNRQLERLYEMGALVYDYFGLRLEFSPYFAGLAEEFGGTFEGWTLFVASNTRRLEAIQEFLNYIFAE
ncbi:MAG: hypothetical protein FWC93_02120 [Defluviitaleaceae bacterium]|nr:hypothetical protein [Defluviitaleaceae bacterium]